MEIISRSEAKARGLKRYYTGRPCKYGHVAERHTIDGCCYACSRIKQNKRSNDGYFKNWYRKNRKSESVKHKFYYVTNRAKILARVKCYAKENAAKIGSYHALWASKNREKLTAYNRCYQKEWRERPGIRARLRHRERERYYIGPQNPRGEHQWLSKAKVELRNVRRLSRPPKGPMENRKAFR